MILITGASGRIARRTADLLTKNGLRLRLMSRSPDRVQKFEGSEIVYGDFAQPSTLTDALADVDVVLVVSGSSEPGKRAQLHRNAFEAAARAHVRHIVYLSLQGASPNSVYPFSRDHYLSEQFLSAVGVPFTVLRNAFYIDMFLEKVDADGVIRGPGQQGRGAFISREDVARTAAAVLSQPPGGIYDITGPEALNIAAVAMRLSGLTGRDLHYQDESVDATRVRWRISEAAPWRVELQVGWFAAIAEGELENTSNAVLRFTGIAPSTLDSYFHAFPELLRHWIPGI